MKVLITGIGGFVGKYLADEVSGKGIEVYGTDIVADIKNVSATVSYCDLTNPEQVDKAINGIKPDFIYHLAGQSNVSVSWKKPALTFSVNVIAAVNLFEAVRRFCPACRILIIGSSDEYGVVKPEQCPVSENMPLAPHSPYAISKSAQEEMAKLYCSNYGLDIIMVRAFNHIGVGQKLGFVVTDFASKIAAIEKKSLPPVISVGNLDARRDFSDVRDIVHGYHLLMEKGRTAEVYNIGSGRAIRIRDVLDKLLSMSKVPIEVKIDSEKLRPSDVPVICCDNTKITADTGWHPLHDIDEALEAVLDYYRNITN